MSFRRSRIARSVRRVAREVPLLAEDRHRRCGCGRPLRSPLPHPSSASEQFWLCAWCDDLWGDKHAADYTLSGVVTQRGERKVVLDQDRRRRN